MKDVGRLRRLLLTASIFLCLTMPAITGFAQEIFFNWKPFQPQAELAPAADALLSPGSNLIKIRPFFLPRDINDLYSLPTTPQFRKEEAGERGRNVQWAIYDRGVFSLSLSTLHKRIPERNISGTATNEINRWEMMRSLTTNFLDMPSRERFQYFGDIFEPELKLKIEF